jgi:hypothetical protein
MEPSITVNDIESQNNLKLKNKKKIIMVIYLCVLVGCLGDSALGPIFPLESKRRGIPESIIGLAISISPIFSVISSLFIGK